MSATSSFQIDTFTVGMKHLLDWDKPIKSTTKFRAKTGTRRQYTRYVKEAFTVKLIHLNQTQRDALEALLVVIGTGELHTVKHVTPSVKRYWDGTTAPGAGINTDCNRIRQKCFVNDGWQFTHFDGRPNDYSISLSFEES